MALMSEREIIPKYWARRNEVLPSFPKFHASRGKTRLVVVDFSLRFGGISAVHNVSLDVKQGEFHSIVGPNGAGKSSVLNCISRLYHPQSGDILVDGQSIIKVPPHSIASLGIGRAFQRLSLFRGLTVLENIMVGRHLFIQSGLVSGGLYWGPGLREDIRNQASAEEIIQFLEIEHLRDKRANELSYGQQKRVELGRALALEPSLLLLDEPVAGMTLEEKEDIARFILDIKEEIGMSIVLVEHELDLVVSISDRITVLNFGQVIGRGLPSEVLNMPAVVEAYLGEQEKKAAI